MKRVLKFLGGTVLVLLLVLAGAAGWLWGEVGRSVPLHDGELALHGLIAPVTVERDALGVVTIHADNDVDEARALGFVHAQERFFQMDLQRRSAAGELAALVGAGALRLDAQRRVHRLRRTARAVVEEAPAEYRVLLEAYTEGVNEGLRALRARPFEYLLLRQVPEPWLPEDSMLAVAAMYFDLQGGNALHKRNEYITRAVLPVPVADLLHPRRTTWDAPLVGEPGTPDVVPGPDAYDLRTLPREWFDGTTPSGIGIPFGSNNWAVAGSHTADGRALLANDMHLGLQVPSIWFRASLRRDGRHVTGISLPGTPLIVVGSNGEVAWGFTNSYGDWLDLIILETDPDNPRRYRTFEGWAYVEEVIETIEVSRGQSTTLRFDTTPWGPVMGTMPDGRPYVVRWVAHDSRGYAPGFLALARAGSVDAALDAAQRSGIPAQNFVVADRNGDIAWTIMGQIPHRVRTDGRASLSSEGPAWDGWLAPEEYPVVRAPAGGRIWTANARVVDGEMLEKIGDGGYALGERGRQIRDRLLALDAATHEDMLAIQLDDEARFYARWRGRLLDRLDDATVAQDARLVVLRDAVRDWGGHASVDSVGFRVVRGWRNLVITEMLSGLTAEVRQVDGSWVHRNFRNEEWAWPLLTARPPHLLHPAHPDWESFELAMLMRLLDNLAIARPEDLARATWGALNTVQVRHPLSQVVPMLSRWLDMPPRALPGDGNMPRVQGVRFGASQRMAVSPGHEADGYFHMPGGQSGHPRSPFFGAGHQDWEEGRAAPFMPGSTRHTLRLVPSGDPVAQTLPITLPSGPGAVAPNLTTAPDGSALLSWIEPMPAGGHRLRFSRWRGGAWTEARTISEGQGWFVNWADFPAMIELEDGTLFAHWLEKSGPATFAYDVMVTRSLDGGETWSEAARPHEDGTQTEHGFVSWIAVEGASARLVWLDGRETGGHGHGSHHGDGLMQLRSRVLHPDGMWGEEVVLDDSVCDCCQTAVARTRNGIAVVYRNRTADELRDIWVVTGQDGRWSEPRAVYEDGWRINACPVNGPALVADGDSLTVAWFTAADGWARVLAAHSSDGGGSFGPPATVDDQGGAIGRVALATGTDGRVWVSWLASSGERAEIRLRELGSPRGLGPVTVLSRSSAARTSGFPRIVGTESGLLVVWTEPGQPGGLKAVLRTGS